MIAAIGLGTNLGNRQDNLLQAVGQIEKRIGLVKAQSSFLETKPVGFISENDFLNGVVLVETSFSPLELLKVLQQIEIDMGRSGRFSREEPHLDRSIDLDILFLDNLIVQKNVLLIPHPEMHKRLFVLAPLSEVAPTWVHPLFGKTVQVLLSELQG